MRTSRRWLTVIAAAGGLLIAGSPAIAAEAGPAATAQVLTGQHPVQVRQMAAPAGSGLKAVSSAIQAADPFHICLKNAPTYCLRFVTAGNQETITDHSANYGNFHISNTDALGDSQIENGSGNCLRAGTNNIVKIENGGCVGTNLGDWWFAPAGEPYRIRSLAYSDDMLVHGHVNGFNVWHETPQSGDWYNWAQG